MTNYIIAETGKILGLVSMLHHYAITCKTLQSKYLESQLKYKY